MKFGEISIKRLGHTNEINQIPKKDLNKRSLFRRIANALTIETQGQKKERDKRERKREREENKQIKINAKNAKKNAITYPEKSNETHAELNNSSNNLAIKESSKENQETELNNSSNNLAIKESSKENQETELIEAFKVFDEKNTGRIPTQRLKFLLEEEIVLSQEDLDILKNHEVEPGFIDYVELAKYFIKNKSDEKDLD
jgi:Ca2+-binding EF-hand superfamily protein